MLVVEQAMLVEVVQHAEVDTPLVIVVHNINGAEVLVRIVETVTNMLVV